MTISAKVLRDTYNPYNGARLTTLELYYPRFIHSEVMTYRMWSRNASSSRAIPVKTMIKNILADPAMPLHWGANQKGMQADHENRDSEGNYIPVHVYADEDGYDPATDEDDAPVRYVKKAFLPDMAWKVAMWAAVHVAKAFDHAGYHKQIVNRLLEPFMHIRVVVTATEYDNMFAQRLHPDAQPEFQELAKAIKAAMLDSNPYHFDTNKDRERGEAYFHLPYITDEDRAFLKDWTQTQWDTAPDPEFDSYTDYRYWVYMKVCAARCARVSYNLHDGRKPDIMDDLRLADDLMKSGHWSPFEHACAPCGCPNFHDNLRGFVHFRRMIQYRMDTKAQKEAALANANMIASMVGGIVQEGPDGTPFVVQSSELEDGTDIASDTPISSKGRTLN